MRLDDLINDFPETPEFIHQMVLEEVEAQSERNVVSISAGKKRRRSILPAAMIAAACVLTATITYAAGARIYQLYLEKQGRYGIEAKLGSEENTGKISLPKEIHEVEIEAGYMPEGMEWGDDEYKSRIYNPENPNLGGITIAKFLLDNNSFDAVLQEKGVVESEQRSFGSREGIYLKYQDFQQDGGFNQRIYLLCPEEYQMLLLYIGDDVSKEDAIKVAENISLVKTEKMVKTGEAYTWSSYLCDAVVEGGDTEINTIVAEDELKIRKVGDAIEIDAMGEDASGEHLDISGITVRLDEIQISDDLSLLDGKNIPEEWQSATRSDGKLLDRTFSYIKAGDGVESIDEIVRTESVRQKLVYARVTYENPTETKINHMLYLGALARLRHEDGKYKMYWETTGDDYDKCIIDGVKHSPEMAYSSVREDYGNGGNYIPNLKPGESVQVEMAWLVDERDLDDIYLDLTGTGGYVQFTEEELESGLFKVH